MVTKHSEMNIRCMALSFVCLGTALMEGCRIAETVAPQPALAKAIAEQKPFAPSKPSVPTSRQQSAALPKRILAPVVVEPTATPNPLAVTRRQAEEKRKREEEIRLLETRRQEAEVKLPAPWQVVSPVRLADDCLTNVEISGEVRNTDTQASHSLKLTWGIYDSSGTKIGSVSDDVNQLRPGKVWRYHVRFLDAGRGSTAKFASASSPT